MNSTEENLRQFPSLPGSPCSDPSFWHRIYRISSGSCVDSHCDLCSDGCGGNPSGCTSFQGEPHRILHFYGCRFQRALPWNHLWRYHRHPALFRSCDPESYQPATLFPWHDPGQRCLFDLSRNRYAYPIKGVVIYRFSENLFFANVKIFQEDIENSIQKDTKVVIVDASAINSIDVTAADRLDAISASLKNEGSVLPH